jgi:predicted MPP superfamily phosphohydrolase
VEGNRGSDGRPSAPPPWGGIELAFERIVYRTGWPARVAGLVGYRPRVTVTHHRIRVAPGMATRRLRIGYASDFHAGGSTNPEVLDSACRELAAAAPDVVLFGGDFVGTTLDPMPDLTLRLGGLPAPLGRYAVLGNHDWWTDAGGIVAALERSGITLLTNRNVRLPAPFQDVFLCGLDDPCGYPDGDAAFAGAEGTRIVLMHQPSGVLDIGDRAFALALCGHTHGGQIALPGGIPVVLPSGRLSRRYSRGRYELGGGGVLVVSRGVGCSTLPFRLFAPPEVIVCDVELGPAAGASSASEAGANPTP